MNQNDSSPTVTFAKEYSNLAQQRQGEEKDPRIWGNNPQHTTDNTTIPNITTTSALSPTDRIPSAATTPATSPIPRPLPPLPKTPPPLPPPPPAVSRSSLT